MGATLRDSILKIAVKWLQGGNNGKLLYTIGLANDAVIAWAQNGVRARWPSTAPSDALGHIGNDRVIERGPSQVDDGYRAQLRQACDTWRLAGAAATILRQLRAYFAPGNGPPMRVVSDRNVWHEIDQTSGVVTRTKVSPANWIWDSFHGTRWRRGWVIIDARSFITIDLWGDPGDWGDGGVWGSDATFEELVALRLAIIMKWKPAHIYVPTVILTFDPTLFLVTNTDAQNVHGQGESSAWRAPLLANFLGDVLT